MTIEQLYKTPPPPFGHALLNYFAIDPTYTNLNHGSYGSTPRPVLEYVAALSEQIEASPDRFHRLEYQPLLVAARARVAALIGAHVDECVLVPNTSHGINTVLRNFDWSPDDVIVIAATTYGSVARTAQSISDAAPHPAVSVFPLTFPEAHADTAARFATHLATLLPRPRGKVVAVIDSIASNPGARLPWPALVTAARAAGAWSVVDAAHSIGQEPGIDVGAAQPDFWVSNCHKWLYAKRGCAVLYVPFRNQHLIRTSIPTSHTYVSPGAGPHVFVEQFEWNGTVDFAPYLSLHAALDFRQWLGGEAAINAYCHALAVAGGARLAAVLGTTVLDTSPTAELTAHMTNVALPLSVPWTPRVDLLLKEKLLRGRASAYGAHFVHAGRWWVRCSAQVYNEIADFEVLGRRLKAVCAEVAAELGEGKAKL